MPTDRNPQKSMEWYTIDCITATKKTGNKFICILKQLNHMNEHLQYGSSVYEFDIDVIGIEVEFILVDEQKTIIFFFFWILMSLHINETYIECK